jgi:cardiolipin synthase
MTDDAARLCPDPRELRPGNRVHLLEDGAHAYPRMLEAVARAERSIYLEMYIFADDVVGRRFAKALAARARDGLEVRFLYDAVGSKETPRDFFGWMRSQGVRVVEFNPIPRFFFGLRFRRRNHRKLLIVDGRVAFLGGMNVSREYAPTEEGGLGWRDTQVEIKGPVVTDLLRTAQEVWCRQARCAPLPPPEADLLPPQERGIPARILSSHRLKSRWEIGRHYRHALRHARERIWIANPYFLPSGRFQRDLRQAARRGVDIRLLVPSRSDVPPALYATQHLFARLLTWGVRLFEWPGPMMHAKTAVIDGTWVTVGSYNIDHLSLMHNHELTSILLDRGFGSEVEAMFERDFARSGEVKADAWMKRGWGHRVLEGLAYELRLFF